MMEASLVFIGLFLLASRLSIDVNSLVNALPILIMLLFLAVFWFKNRVTHSRTGYAAPRRPSSYTVGLFAVSLFFSFSNRLIPEDTHILSRGYPLLFGAFLAVTLLLAGQGLRRFYVYAAVALLTGVGALAAGFEPELGMALTALVTGLLLLVSGGRVLRRYLAEHPRPEGEG